MIPKELAEKEIQKWLDFKKVSQTKRKDKKDAINVLVNAITDGNLVLTDNLLLEQTLNFPLGKDTKITKLVYKNRLSVAEIQQETSNMASTDVYAMIGAYIACLTEQPKAIVFLLDTEDYSIAQSIASFFI